MFVIYLIFYIYNLLIVIYIYKISNILQTINANVCDTVVINIDNCGRYTGRNKVKIQQINITYSWFIKKSEFILSNYEIQFYNWYWILIKK